ncbi:MAG: protease modulator HflC, partial [Ferrovibrionaceae bacterium]
MNRGILIVVGLIVLGLFVLFGSVFTVNQTQQALVLQLGEPVRMIREPGLKFKLPFIQNVTYFDKRILSLDAPPEEIIAADQRRLVVDSFARFRIVDVLKFFQTLGNETVARSRLASQLNSALRRVLGSQDSIAVISGERAQLMTEIARIVNVEAARFGIEIIDVRIKRADYPD